MGCSSAKSVACATPQQKLTRTVTSVLPTENSGRSDDAAGPSERALRRRARSCENPKLSHVRQVDGRLTNSCDLSSSLGRRRLQSSDRSLLPATPSLPWESTSSWTSDTFESDEGPKLAGLQSKACSWRQCQSGSTKDSSWRQSQSGSTATGGGDAWREEEFDDLEEVLAAVEDAKNELSLAARLSHPWIEVESERDGRSAPGSMTLQPVLPGTPSSIERLGPLEHRSEKETGARELLEDLNTVALHGLLPPGSPQRIIIQSDTDPELHRRSGFSPKAVRVHCDSSRAGVGHAAEAAAHGVGYACKKGLKSGTPNQDSFIISVVPGKFSLYGIFDGHGQDGHNVSNFAKDVLPKVLLSDADDLLWSHPRAALKRAFAITQELLREATTTGLVDARASGTTASVVLHDHRQQTLYLAHVGDSRCVLASMQPDICAWQATHTSRDHTPYLASEQQRIERCGGQVLFNGGAYRAYTRGKPYPGLNMSRTLGDLGHQDSGLLSCDPDVVQLPIRGDHQRRKSTTSSTPQSTHPSFLLLCSDGVWDFVETMEAVDLVAKLLPREAMVAAEGLAHIAWDRWMKGMKGELADDITALVIPLGGNF